MCFLALLMAKLDWRTQQEVSDLLKQEGRRASVMRHGTRSTTMSCQALSGGLHALSSSHVAAGRCQAGYVFSTCSVLRWGQGKAQGHYCLRPQPQDLCSCGPCSGSALPHWVR